MVIKARSWPFLHGPLAETQRISILYGIQIHIKSLAVRIGTEVQAAVFYHPSCLEDSGKVFIGDPYQRITLSVLKKDIVVGIIFLYDVVLQNKGLILVSCYYIVYCYDLLHQSRSLGVPIGQEV